MKFVSKYKKLTVFVPDEKRLIRFKPSGGGSAYETDNAKEIDLLKKARYVKCLGGAAPVVPQVEPLAEPDPPVEQAPRRGRRPKEG